MYQTHTGSGREAFAGNPGLHAHAQKEPSSPRGTALSPHARPFSPRSRTPSSRSLCDMPLKVDAPPFCSKSTTPRTSVTGSGDYISAAVHPTASAASTPTAAIAQAPGRTDAQHGSAHGTKAPPLAPMGSVAAHADDNALDRQPEPSLHHLSGTITPAVSEADMPWRGPFAIGEPADTAAHADVAASLRDAIKECDARHSVAVVGEIAGDGPAHGTEAGSMSAVRLQSKAGEETTEAAEQAAAVSSDLFPAPDSDNMLPAAACTSSLPLRAPAASTQDCLSRECSQSLQEHMIGEAEGLSAAAASAMPVTEDTAVTASTQSSRSDVGPRKQVDQAASSTAGVDFDASIRAAQEALQAVAAPLGKNALRADDKCVADSAEQRKAKAAQAFADANVGRTIMLQGAQHAWASANRCQWDCDHTQEPAHDN